MTEQSMTYEDAAQHLGVKVATIASYVDKEILVGEGNMKIASDSVFKYEEERGKNRKQAARTAGKSRGTRGRKVQTNELIRAIYRMRGLVDAMETMDVFDAPMLKAELNHMETLVN